MWKLQMFPYCYCLDFSQVHYKKSIYSCKSGKHFIHTQKSEQSEPSSLLKRAMCNIGIQAQVFWRRRLPPSSGKSMWVWNRGRTIQADRIALYYVKSWKLPDGMDKASHWAYSVEHHCIKHKPTKTWFTGSRFSYFCTNVTPKNCKIVHKNI